MAEVYVMGPPFFFFFWCSSLVKSEPAWLRSKGLKFKGKRYFCCINIDRTSMQMETFAFFFFFFYISSLRLTMPWIACRQRARLMIERLQVQMMAEVAGEFSSPELTLCANYYSVSIPPSVTAVAQKRPQSFCQKCRWQIS